MTSGNSPARTLPSLAQAESAYGSPGDPVPSFATIYKLYFDFVWSSARRLGVSSDAIDDVVQEVFMVIHARIHTLKQPDSLRSWVYGIVRRTVSNYRRSRLRPETSGLDLGFLEEIYDSSDRTPFEDSARNDQLQLLAKLVGELDDVKREIFVLAELEEMTVPEIAQVLEIPLNTAYSRLRVARQAFEHALDRFEARERERGGKKP